MKIMLNNALNNTFCVESLHEIGFHNFILMISTFPSTICDKSSASYARTLAQYSVSAGTRMHFLGTGVNTLCLEQFYGCLFQPLYTVHL
jgi:hypothetical protein